MYSAVVMLKIEARPGCTENAVARPGKQVSSELEQGLNFTVNVDFWFCNEDFCKNPEGKKGD